MRGIEFYRRAVFRKHTLNNLSTHECSRARKVWEQAMGTVWRQYNFKSEHRQQRLKEVQGYEWVLIFSWLGALVLWGFMLWAASTLLCNTVQLVRYVPGLLP
jgi:hypothetical protein